MNKNKDPDLINFIINSEDIQYIHIYLHIYFFFIFFLRRMLQNPGYMEIFMELLNC